MKKALLVLAISLLIIPCQNFAQKKRRSVKKPQASTSTIYESACGIRQTLDEMAEEFRVKWRPVVQSKNATFFYDTQDEFCDRSTGVLKVWIKTVPKEGSGIEFDHSLDQYEMKCRDYQYRVTSYIEYNSGGDILKSESWPNEEWKSVAPDSIGQELFNTVCRYTK